MNPEPAAGQMQVEVRACSGFAELDGCVELQRQIWGYSSDDVIPRRLFVVAKRIGGQTLGAFSPSGEMVGFAMALPGWREGMSYLHSHMLAVLPAYRNSGLGRRLKLAQREDALGRGILLMEWTFDPLEAKNSFFNIEKLGAVARSYSPDIYGVSSARLQGGRPTDRLHAEWWMDSERVRRAIAGERPSAGPSAVPVRERIELPEGLGEWKESDAGQEQTLTVQAANRARFQEAFARGLTVTGFMRGHAGGGTFQLSHWLPETAFCEQGNEMDPSTRDHDSMSEAL
jgi:predicted GNAT superfamily acetyltransferase